MNKIFMIDKVKRTGNFFVERTLPDLGEVFVKAGDSVEPFTKIGQAKVSYFFQKVPSGQEILKEPNEYVEKGVLVSRVNKGQFKYTNFYAPYNGFLRPVGDGSFVFEQDKEKFELFSGAWGVVKSVVENKSVLISGSATVIYCAVASSYEAEGELVVLPNPTELLEDPYFANFTKEVSGKIIYSGHFIKLENLKRAIKIGVRGIIAGGFDKESLDFAQKSGFALASISGFGRIPTPDQIFDFFSQGTNRYIFIRGPAGEILIPSKDKFEEESGDKDFLIEIKNDMIVQVLERPYFGWIGSVKSVDKDRVKIAFPGRIEEVLVRPTNLLALDFF